MNTNDLCVCLSGKVLSANSLQIYDEAGCRPEIELFQAPSRGDF